MTDEFNASRFIRNAVRAVILLFGVLAIACISAATTSFLDGQYVPAAIDAGFAAAAAAGFYVVREV